MPVLDERGYLIVAVNTESTDYVACARQLAQSLRHWHPSAKICLLTDSDLTDKLFDHVVLLPQGDQSQTQWKLSNDWQAGIATPFRQTIKLEADMLIASPIDHWWTMLEHRDLSYQLVLEIITIKQPPADIIGRYLMLTICRMCTML